MDGAVTECDAGDSYQKWKVHQVGGLLKVESAAPYDHNMCLAVVHQDPEHETNAPDFFGEPVSDYDDDEIVLRRNLASEVTGAAQMDGAILVFPSIVGGGWGNLGGAVTLVEFSEADVEGMCNGKLGLAHCDHPGSYWYNTGGNLLSALCWDQGTSTAMRVEGCTDLVAAHTTASGDLTTSETFMLLGST